MRKSFVAAALLLAAGPSFADANGDLLEASLRGDVPALSSALAQGADANTTDEHGLTALMYSAAVGKPDEIRGQAISVFVTLRNGEPDEEMRKALRMHVRKEIGALAQPDDIHFTSQLPKTRSGKIMRRLLRDIASGKEQVGDT